MYRSKLYQQECQYQYISWHKHGNSGRMFTLWTDSRYVMTRCVLLREA